MIENYVLGLYDKGLNRAAETEGFFAHLNYLKVDLCFDRMKTVGSSFYDSPEFKNRNLSDRQFVEAVYGSQLNRAPEKLGLEGWLKYLQSHSRMETFNSIASSVEGHLVAKNFITGDTIANPFNPQIHINDISANPVFVDPTNKYGFEGGKFIQEGNTTYAFVTEMYADSSLGLPYTRQQIGQWENKGCGWHRVRTVIEDTNPNESIWISSAYHNNDQWNLTIVKYKPDWSDGVTYRYSSPDLNSTFVNQGIEAQIQGSAWEASNSMGGILPYRVGDDYYGFYCSSNPSEPSWYVGLAKLENGQWTRQFDNPVIAEKIENPIVVQLDCDKWVALYDTQIGQWGSNIGYSTSNDGIHWSAGKDWKLSLPWVKDLRTVNGIIKQQDGSYDIYYTARTTQKEAYWEQYKANVSICF